MSKLIDALKAIAAGDDVTPVTRVTHAEVTRKPAWIKAVTPVTRVTPRSKEYGECEALGVFEGRVDVLVMRGVIDRQKADALVEAWCQHRDIAETRVTILEVSNDLTRCGRCIHARKPGNRAYCGNGRRADLAPASGALAWFPPDLGLNCQFWVKRHE